MTLSFSFSMIKNIIMCFLSVKCCCISKNKPFVYIAAMLLLFIDRIG